MLAFRGNELLMSIMGKSYSTGEYHHPDGSIYAIAAQWSRPPTKARPIKPRLCCNCRATKTGH